MAIFFFRKGPVRILSTNQEGHLIGPARPGIYKVLVGTSILDCAENDLMPLGERPEERRSPLPERTKKGVRLGKFEASPMFSNTIDIHGLSVKDAIELVGRKINRALLAEADRIRIVHDRRTPKLNKALEQYLSSLKFVREFAPDEGNPNVTWVYFRTAARE